MLKRQHGARAVSLLLLVCLALSAFSLGASAADAWQKDAITDIVHTHYKSIPVTTSFSSAKIRSGRLIDGTPYLPMRFVFSALLPSATVTYSSKTRTMTAVSSTLTFSATDGAYYVVANGRYLYTQAPVVILSDERMYLPASLFEKALGYSFTYDSKSGEITVSGRYSPILSGDKFYREDEVYWLSRIISAESRGEPLLGQIAVGNVVMNRVASAEFPNTIWGVIFDRKWGVQFTPVSNGTVYASPAAISVVAAKLVLEGNTVSSRVLYFFEPQASTSTWIARTRTYRFRIGAHLFYS